MTLSFRALASGAGVAGALASATLVASAPAEAAAISVGSTIQFSSVSNGSVFFDSATGGLDFNAPTPLGIGNPQRIEAGLGTGDFEGVGPRARISDLMLTNSGGGIYTLSAPVNNFVTRINLPPLLSGFNDVQLNLTEFVFDSNSGTTTSLRGFFVRDGQQTAAVGRFTSQVDFQNPSTWSMSVEAVPTPALLPGLVGMGIATLRRKSDQTANEEAEA